jgi:hypothetical protein
VEPVDDGKPERGNRDSPTPTRGRRRFSIREGATARAVALRADRPQIGFFDGKWNRFQNHMENK